MDPAALAAAFGVGLLTGLLSGLVGIGGGVLMVPFLYLFYAHAAWAGVRLTPEVATLAAHATSLFVILPTSVLGAWAFGRTGLVVWRAAVPIGVAAALAAVAAAQVADQLDPRWLRLSFGMLLLVSGWRLYRTPGPAVEGADAPERPVHLSLPVTTGVGATMGVFSALLGVGGGVVGVPLLIHVVRLELKRVAATSLAIVTATSLGGVAAYMVDGPASPVRPGWSVGYVDFGVGLALVAGTLLSVRWGTTLNRRLNPRTLAVVFALLFAVSGARLVMGNLPW
ncbi:sulfite exporter TauE/SafE family protein [Longimicrobium sp.]|uniref:sulfite exporter TauE/SafE family protein n=1 Tax=Longimicrobium sp. TaxID=2029185 RepID=UPI002C890C8E|nr:sulfite exporter TauE/SafE family protein [Longimicrobium sp.]HSU15289.1 sulfite exporter TauE/SafE family protein [Longimicrobium sp.]